MHLVLDPKQNAAHGDWLRQTPGAYEWWYFDALSDDGLWSLACIWFLGNPFSPYYRMSAQGIPADPYTHNALFFALYRHGSLYAYHFTSFPRASVFADESRPATLRFGPNQLDCTNGSYQLTLADENANRRVLNANLMFQSPGLKAKKETGKGSGQDNHFWLPAAPGCRVTARIILQEAQNSGAEQIAFTGFGYHDHNWGTLPFAADLREWYWARASLEDGRAAILYHVNSHMPQHSVSHMLLFENGQLTYHNPLAIVQPASIRINAFGTRYATCLHVQSSEIAASFHLEQRLDSSPFYVRTLSQATLTQQGRSVNGRGMAEYFRPRLLGTALVASATKARIVTP